MDLLMPVQQPLTDRSLADRVADRLRASIQDGTYPPGTRLVERTIARELGVSHIPVREALARLADERIVERLPRRGARVAQLSPAGLDEICTLRVVLERLVVRRAQERLTPESEAELRAIAQRMLDAADAGDVDRVIELDQTFHARLWALADHGLLNELAAQVRGRITAFLWAATRTLPPEELRSHAQTHVALVDAVAAGRPGEAEREMELHITIAAERVRRTLTGTHQAAAR
jgi:DNA-binding GntR family transcriptional regulator